MIKDILTKAKSAVSQPISQPEAAPTPIPQPAPAPKPEAILKATPKKTHKELAVETAAQVGYSAGDEVTARICRHQPARHPRMLFVDVPDWSEPVVCWVKDAASWQPVNPPYDRIKARWSGMADVEGRLIFESADECKKSRLIRRK
ncbi:MAG: hypothetical protein EBR82_38590 [Caulobacteraceae bacterium]|nr:hypothetical protein [Caulobacteraceae bacterium]